MHYSSTVSGKDVAATAEEGLAFLKADKPYDVLIADIRSIGSDSVNFFAQCDQLNPSALIFLLIDPSSIEDASLLINSYRFFKVLTTSITPDHLLQAIGEARESIALKTKHNELSDQVEMFSKVMARIEFTTEGTISSVNALFCRMLGYSPEELIGQHINLIASAEQLEAMWLNLELGTLEMNQFSLITKHNIVNDIKTTLSPIFGHQEELHKVVLYASDITESVLQNAYQITQLQAINQHFAVADYNSQGILIGANENFTDIIGYSLYDIQAEHHSIFVENEHKESETYLQFWESLKNGITQNGKFKRIGLNEREVWVESTFIPVKDLNDEVFRIVEYSTDITAIRHEEVEIEIQLSAINKANLVAEFLVDGTLINANDNFLEATGYSIEDLIGQHHSTLIGLKDEDAEENRSFWEKLGQQGTHENGQFRFLTKHEQEIWFQASFDPILDLNQKPLKVMMLAQDITEDKLQAAYFQGQIDAILEAQLVVDFDPWGNVLKANQNYLDLMEFDMYDVQSCPESTFIEDEEPFDESDAYRAFWEKLENGKTQVGTFKRIGNEGKEVWLQASYVPLKDFEGNVFRVIQYATDITEQSLNEADDKGQIKAISEAQCVIEFQMDGTIITANEKFLQTMEYRLEEIQGHNHKMLVEQGNASTPEYIALWKNMEEGLYKAGLFKQIGKEGKEVWLQATYNPILDLNGNPFKVVQYATDVTEDMLQNADYKGQISAIDAAQSIIEFQMDGTVITANDNFLHALGYRLEELQDQNHAFFLEPDYAGSAEYNSFWRKLGEGQFEAGLYKYIGKEGKEIWMQATYNPILNLNGNPFKVVQYATDVTEDMLKNADYKGQISAIDKAQAIVEFNMDGTIINANDNFLQSLGYRLDEIQGNNHTLFLEPDYTNSPEYTTFWNTFLRGEYEAGLYKRLGKDNKEVWVQATYNPIFDLNGNPFKVVQYATDVTEDMLRNANFQGQIAAISKAQAVIEFQMDGTIISANDNFLQAMGYRLEEIQGRHHKLFVESSFATSQEYASFWAKFNRGEHEAGQYKQLGKTGNTVWLQATYNPIFDLNGNPFKVVTYATDVTQQVENVSRVAENAQLLSNSSGQMAKISEHLSQNADQTSTQVNFIKTVSDKVNTSVQDVASAARKMQNSFQEVANNAQNAATVATDAVDMANRTNKLVEQLNSSSTQIGSVIKTITAIAQQTNLLALNATIEAAKAGDTGKGFSVVANEVKELARQTAGATEEISAKIKAIQDDTTIAISSIGEISSIISKINEIQSAIVHSVEEQTKSTHDIVTHVELAATGTDEITREFSEVAGGAIEIKQNATESMDTAKELATMAESLKEIVTLFDY